MAFGKKHRDPFIEVQHCLRKRNYKAALGYFRTLLSRDSESTQIRLRFADTLVLAGSKKQAIEQYRRVADELSNKGFMTRAIAISKRILEVDPDQRDIYEKLAELNRAREASRKKTTSLAEVLTRPDAPLRRDVKRVSDPRSALSEPNENRKPEPASSFGTLLESMKTEFGASGRPSASIASSDESAPLVTATRTA